MQYRSERKNDDLSLQWVRLVMIMMNYSMATYRIIEITYTKHQLPQPLKTLERIDAEVNVSCTPEGQLYADE